MKQFTQEAYDDLVKSIEKCKESLQQATLRMGITAQEDTWHDNSAFDQAQEEVRNLTSHLANLQGQLRGATVVVASTSGEIGVGSMIDVTYQDGEEEVILLDGRTVHGNTNGQAESATRVSTSSPIGSALLGCREGETVTYTVPNGTTLSLKVTKVH